MKNYSNCSNLKLKQGGFTLIEMGIVLIIIAVLAGAALGGMSMYKSAKNDGFERGLNNIVGNLQTKMRNDAVTTGMSNATVIATGVLAKTGWTSNVAVITHPLRSTAVFTAGTISTAGDAISVALAGIPYDSCSDIARDMTAHAEAITIGATAVQTSSMTPATGAAIDTACGTTGTVAVTGVYPKIP